MNSGRLEEIMQSHGVINITYDGAPVWVEGMRGELAEVTFIDSGKRIDVPITVLIEK